MTAETKPGTGKSTLPVLAVFVRDNGIGFDMKFHDRIFDLYRLRPDENNPMTRRPGSAGL